ncbi:P-loop containing nucleoside triphosphate hydrolase protein, partial [Suillus clintonianus]|uniref:P-loop containing nucleoside triphosphate hydrolase protein n=1 Tax=Suillus clintonianus TaxID=1904413 RepID=UPI001B871156
LVAGTQTALTSPDAAGCTTETKAYNILIQNKTLKIKLYDTIVGLGEGPEGTVPDREARRVLKKLLRDLMKQIDIHLLMYCVRGVRATKALCRNYDLIRSEVKERVPIVLVATALEDQAPEMEEWWRKNEKLISDFGMTFAGHACVTTATIDKYAEDSLRWRRIQSYHAVCQLIERCRLSKAVQTPLSEVGRWLNTIRQLMAGDEVTPTTSDVRRRMLQRSDDEIFKAIVLFGDTGAGKSSLINLMAGKEVAGTSPDTERCTMHWQEYNICFGNMSYKVFDTVGLEAPDLGIKEYLEFVENAYQLIKRLDKQGGIDLLLFCVRAGRVTATLQNNYRLFHEFLCEKKVPIVLAITGLERELRMEDYWERNKGIFSRYQIQVAGHACITAADRLDGRHKDLYEESRVTIRNLVEQFTADGQKQAWMGGDNLFVSLMRKLKELLVGSSHVRRRDLVPHLTKRCGMSREVAKQLADMIKQDEAA